MNKNALEWSVFGLGLLLLTVLVGCLVAFSFGDESRPAELRVRLGKSERVEKGYRTRVRVENVGDETAMGVKVKVDDAELDFDYVPRHSSREGDVYTDAPPKQGRAVSSQTP